MARREEDMNGPGDPGTGPRPSVDWGKVSERFDRDARPSGFPPEPAREAIRPADFSRATPTARPQPDQVPRRPEQRPAEYDPDTTPTPPTLSRARTVSVQTPGPAQPPPGSPMSSFGRPAGAVRPPVPAPPPAPRPRPSTPASAQQPIVQERQAPPAPERHNMPAPERPSAPAVERHSGPGPQPLTRPGTELQRTYPPLPLRRQEVDGLRERWPDIKATFVDDPRQSVQQADRLVMELTQLVTQRLTEERARIEGAWSNRGEVSTEDLRQALHQYQLFFDRLTAS